MKNTLLKIFVSNYTQPVPKHVCYMLVIQLAGYQLCILMGTVDKYTIDQAAPRSA